MSGFDLSGADVGGRLRDAAHATSAVGGLSLSRTATTDALAETGVARRRLAVLHGQLGPGGSERQLLLLLEQCDGERWLPHVYTGLDGVIAEEIRARGVGVTVLRGGPLGKLWHLRRALTEQHAEALLSWGSWTNVFAWTAGPHLPCVGSFRSAGFSDLPLRRRQLWAWASRYRLSTVVCNSRETAELLAVHARPHQRVLFVPNAVEPLPRARLHRRRWRERLGVGEDEVLVMGMGRITPLKHFERFVAAVGLCRLQHPEVRGIIVGMDHEGRAAALQQHVERAKLPPGTVRLVGPLAQSRQALAAADVFLLTSRREGMPNVVMEAMAAGVPCVCTPVSGVSSLIDDGVDGRVVRDHPEDLAAAVGQLVGDAALRARMSRRAQARVTFGHAPKEVYGPLWAELGAQVDAARRARRARYTRRTRVLDVALALLAVPLLLPVAAALALAVRLSGPGPVLHRGLRLGRDGVPFHLHKFRTMQPGAELRGPGVTVRGDPRVTRVGVLLRRTKLDELPQVLDVLSGRMSWVGPRPEDPRYVDPGDPLHRRALSVRPGVTSPASLLYRDEESQLAGPDWERRYRRVLLPRKLAMDVAFLEQASVRAYLAVLGRTAVLLLRGVVRR